MWPFTDGIQVATAADRVSALRLLDNVGQRWDDHLQRFLACLPGVVFPLLAGPEHERAAVIARDLLAA